MQHDISSFQMKILAKSKLNRSKDFVGHFQCWLLLLKKTTKYKRQSYAQHDNRKQNRTHRAYNH